MLSTEQMSNQKCRPCEDSVEAKPQLSQASSVAYFIKAGGNYYRIYF